MKKLKADKKRLIQMFESENFNENIIEAFKEVRREDYVPEKYLLMGYLDQALPLSNGGSISRPHTIAFMLQLLELEDSQKILEIGSGSGYVLELINKISKKSKIYGIEIIPELAEDSKRRLPENIQIINGDGSSGYPSKAPHDRILVGAAYNDKPTHLLSQLNEGGILVCPVNDAIIQFKKSNGIIYEKEFGGFSFLPIIQN